MERRVGFELHEVRPPVRAGTGQTTDPDACVSNRRVTSSTDRSDESDVDHVACRSRRKQAGHAGYAGLSMLMRDRSKTR